MIVNLGNLNVFSFINFFACECVCAKTNQSLNSKNATTSTAKTIFTAGLFFVPTSHSARTTITSLTNDKKFIIFNYDKKICNNQAYRNVNIHLKSNKYKRNQYFLLLLLLLLCFDFNYIKITIRGE